MELVKFSIEFITNIYDARIRVRPTWEEELDHPRVFSWQVLSS